MTHSSPTITRIFAPLASAAALLLAALATPAFAETPTKPAREYPTKKKSVKATELGAQRTPETAARFGLRSLTPKPAARVDEEFTTPETDVKPKAKRTRSANSARALADDESFTPGATPNALLPDAATRVAASLVAASGRPDAATLPPQAAAAPPVQLMSPVTPGTTVSQVPMHIRHALPNSSQQPAAPGPGLYATLAAAPSPAPAPASSPVPQVPIPPELQFTNPKVQDWLKKAVTQGNAAIAEERRLEQQRRTAPPQPPIPPTNSSNSHSHSSNSHSHSSYSTGTGTPAATGALPAPQTHSVPLAAQQPVLAPATQLPAQQLNPSPALQPQPAAPAPTVPLSNRGNDLLFSDIGLPLPDLDAFTPAPYLPQIDPSKFSPLKARIDPWNYDDSPLKGTSGAMGNPSALLGSPLRLMDNPFNASISQLFLERGLSGEMASGHVADPTAEGASTNSAQSDSSHSHSHSHSSHSHSA